MQAEKKQLEIMLIDYFRHCYPEFPKGRVVPSESPDFLVKMKSKNQLGIELTRLNPANAEPPTDREIHEIHFREELIEHTKQIFERTSDKLLFVKFLFSERKKIIPERAMSVSVRLAGLIRNIIQAHKKKLFYYKSLPSVALPEGIDELLVISHPKLKVSVCERSNNLGLSNNVVDDIRQAIFKKEEKLKLYHKSHLNYYWLLVFSDRLRGTTSFNIDNKISKLTVNSRFQQVILFDLMKSKVFELV